MTGTAIASPWYVQAHGEFTWMEDTDLDIGGAKAGDLEYDLEYAAGATLGYDFQPFRVEIEAMYREADFDDLANSVVAPAGFGGSIETYTAMVNAYYDIDTGSNWAPYVGAGLGVAQHEFDSITIQTSDEDTVLAYQAMAGISYNFSDYPAITIGGGYRFFGTQSPEFSDRTGTKVELDNYAGHNLEYFIRWNF